MRIGIAGIGKMGTAMAARLIETGAEVVAWNRTRARAEASGLPIADTPRDLAERSDVVMTTLFDAAAVEAVYHGAGGGTDGLLSAAPGKLFIEMSTVRPKTQVALAAAVRGAGGAFVECPVGGTTGPARAGKLLGLVGGEAADLDRARPVLDRLCRRVEHVGPVGAGAAMKLAINLPLLVFYQALGESVALVRQLGLDPAWLMELFADTAGGPNVLKVRGPAIAAALAGADPGAPAFDIDSIRKDLRTMVAEAGDRGFNLPVAAQALAVFDEASEAGWGKRDGAWLPSFWAAKGA
jgi:3-hydroxyisobutyrate dehydrogenase